MLRHRLRTASSLFALVATLIVTSPASAADGTVAATELNGFGRFVFTLDKPVKAQVRSSSGIVVITFDEPVNVELEKLPGQAPSYISVARRDPDGRTVRFATTRPLRTNILEAGEKIFVDLLPPAWTGLPPSLPQEVVEQLAKRAREAEEQLRKANREREKRQLRDMTARVGQGPTFARLILDAGQTVPVDIQRDGDQLTLTFDAALQLDVTQFKAQLPDTVRDIQAVTNQGILKLTIAVSANAEMRAFREDDTVIVDFPKPKVAGQEAETALPSLAVPKADASASKPVEAPASASQAKRPEPARPAPPPLRSAIDGAGGALRPEAVRSGEGVQIRVPFPDQVPAAAFVRQDVLWMVFDTRDSLEAISVPADVRDRVARIDVDRAGGATIMRVTMNTPEAVSFAPNQTSPGWIASIGRAAALPTETMTLRRGVMGNGRTNLTAKIPSLGQVFWIDDPDTGERLGIVTASGLAHGLPKQQNFVEFSALPTAHGLAISPRADDVMITAALDEVMVSRDSGLTVSLGVPDRRAPVAEGGKNLLLDVEAWRVASHGDIRERTNALQRIAADAPKKDQSERRLKLAELRLANGDAVEAKGILRVIEQDDPTAAATKPVLLLRAVAGILSKDYKDAARVLNESSIALEAESFLWQGVLNAHNQRWTAALNGFRQGMDVLERYPDSLQLMMRELVVRAALESKDGPFASQQLDILEKMQGPAGHLQKMSLFRGQLAALQNRSPEALSNFEIAINSPEREVEVEARLNKVMLMLDEGKVDRDKAMAELETITMIWRKSEIEVRALAQLGEMYAEDSRWRQAFGAARRVSEVMPEHPLARKLHDNMAKRFEALFLEGKADQLPKVEAVGLFYDFRNLMPISRRGDEIVRRLADRLADLDLVDQAAELLQHQVDNRLGGVARARVAARLAVLHLMNRRPVEAVQTLRASRSNDIPEDVKRGRLLLEARALSELSRTDLALEVLSSQKGDDVDRLRADVLWRGKRWREAGEAIEKLLDIKWQQPEELTDSDRIDVMRAGVSYVLADDRLGLDRLRQKYMPKMAESVDGRSFELVSSNSRNRQQEFRDIARSLVAGSTLSEFLDVYRQRYPDAAGTPRNPKAAEDALKEIQGRRQQGQPSAAPG